MLLLLGALSLTAWAYLLLLHGRFWRSVPELPHDAAASIHQKKIAAVVPARNEAEHIQQSIGTLLAQEYAGEFSVLLVDDNSTDGTAAAAAALDSGDRLTILTGQPLAPGWSGKLWAVHQGLTHPKARAADYVLLTDADIAHAPGHLAALVAKAERDSLDLVSEMVRLNCATDPEHALIPAFIFFFQMLYPFAWAADPSKKLAGAAGGVMLVRRAALDRIGGVEAIRGRLIDDCALARALKSSGARIWLGHANEARSLRVYAEWREIWNMIARTAYEQLRRSPLVLAGCVAGMGLLYLAPPLLALLAHGPAQALGALTWLAMAAAFQPTLRRYNRWPLWGLALPAIALFYLGATIASAVRHHAGRGGGWKSRVYSEVGGPETGANS